LAYCFTVYRGIWWGARQGHVSKRAVKAFYEDRRRFKRLCW
jgi:hypothetical protein